MEAASGALGFVSGGGPLPSLPTAFVEAAATFGAAALDGRSGWFASPSAMAASLRGWRSTPMFSCALRLPRELVVVDEDAMERVMMVGTEEMPGVGPGRSGEEERNRGRRDMAAR